MTTHFILETTDSLLDSYEFLALKHQKNAGKPNNYATAFPLLILNASIVEGILRYWLANSVKKTMDDLVEQGMDAGRSEKNMAEILLENYLIDIEGNGGIEKLKGQYSFFLDVSLDGKSNDYDQQAIRSLFTLRNVLAHGTVLVAPKVQAGSPNKLNYVDSWQSRLQTVTDFLKKMTNAKDIFGAIDDNKVPGALFKESQLFLKHVRSKLPKDLNEGVAYNAMQKLQFGYRSRSRF